MGASYTSRYACVFFLLLVGFSAGAETENYGSYRAAVVEHAPISVPGLVTRSEAVAVMNQNLDVYEGHVASAAADSAQIIVFNEDGLYGDDKCTRREILPYLEYIPDPNGTLEPIIPCDSEEISDSHVLQALSLLEGALDLGVSEGNTSFARQPILKRLSCMARMYGIVIVADMGDIQPCEKGDTACPTDGRYQYNTQVAFDENGKLLAKYHKTHLYYEPQFDAGVPCQPSIFYTSFDVRFSMMICFDMMFGHPTLDYVSSQDPMINDMVYSTWWLNTPPKFSATQVQQAYSRATGMNVLAAGNGNGWLYSGSGIFSKGRVLQQHYNPTTTPMDKLLISDVPKIYVRQNFTTVPTTVEGGDVVVLSASDERESCLQGVSQRQTKKEIMPQPVEFAAHCPVNDSSSDISRGRSSFSGPEMLLRSLGARDQTYSYPYGNLTLSTPFEATWGTDNITASATAGNLTCNAYLSVAEAQPYLAGKDPEIYTVLAYEGWYDGTEDIYQERFCAVYRCRTEATCFDYLIYAHTIMTAFRIEGNFAPGTNLLAMAASDLLYLVEDSAKLQVGFEEMEDLEARAVERDAVVENQRGYVQAVDGFDTILLNASLLGRLLDEDDSDQA